MSSSKINLQLMTRGYSRDYLFLGLEQVDRWWTKYSKWVRFESPTIIIEDTKFFISGISSPKRRDRVGTPIRYTIAGEILNSSSASDLTALQSVTNLIARAIHELKSTNNFSGLAESLDKIGNDLFESALSGDGNSVLRVLDQTKIILLEPGKKYQFVPACTEGYWLCGTNDRGFDHLLATAESALSGCGGKLAAYLNLADESDIKCLPWGDRSGSIVVENGALDPGIVAGPQSANRKSRNKTSGARHISHAATATCVILIAAVLLNKTSTDKTESSLPVPIVETDVAFGGASGPLDASKNDGDKTSPGPSAAVEFPLGSSPDLSRERPKPDDSPTKDPQLHSIPREPVTVAESMGKSEDPAKQIQPLMEPLPDHP